MNALKFTSPALPQIAVLPRAPRNASPNPRLTSLFHWANRGDYGDPSYPGNCSGVIIRDLLLYFQPKTVFDPMAGSETCRDVCDELGVLCTSKDIRFGFDACDESHYAGMPAFDFIWVHPPYWRQKVYSDDLRDLSNAPNLGYFLYRYEKVIRNLAGVLAENGKLAVLMGDYTDRDAGFVPLTYWTKRLAFQCRLNQACTDIIRFSHGARSSTKTYRSSFIPALHDTCMVFQKPSSTTFPHSSHEQR